VTNSESLTLIEGNNEDLLIHIKTNVPVAGTVLDLTGSTVEVYLKESANLADDHASTWKGSTATTGVVLTDAVNGVVTVSFPATVVLPTAKWWRVDVVKGGKRKTAVYGLVSVITI
jgi:hypothetical protein